MIVRFLFLGVLLTWVSMESLALITSVVIIHLLAVISPGPDFIVAVKNSLTYSRVTGLWTAVGFGLGIAVHIVYCAAGLALVISQSILLFNIIKLLGAAYLIYLGIGALLSKSSKLEVAAETAGADLSWQAAVKTGFLTNVLNPKATLFFLSLFTLVITPGTPIAVLVLVSLLMVLNTILWFSLVAIFMTQSRIRAAFERHLNTFNKILGGLLIALGIKVALLQQ